ncbi:MAG TPA: tryptophan synthase subunit alpha, partial [Tepidisphaeraceae bacterium]|nr:tryptophan synthase subunit alpha [Tepidisphaeraceae bacterium]
IAKANVRTPLIAMVSYSIVFRYGVEQFLKDAKSSGFSSVLIPDLPPPEAESVCRLIRAHELDTVLMVAPTTSADRRKTITQLASGFVYYLSVSGITGERDRLPDDLKQNVLDLKSISNVPICVGFGIGKREHVKQLFGVADGAIVGTAIVRALKSDDPARSVADLCKKLLND